MTCWPDHPPHIAQPLRRRRERADTGEANIESPSDWSSQISATNPSWSADRIQPGATRRAAPNRFEHRSRQTQIPRHDNYPALTSRVTVQLSRQDDNASAIPEPTNTSSDAQRRSGDGPSNRSPVTRKN
jgi:hypothetical protein